MIYNELRQEFYDDTYFMLFFNKLDDLDSSKDEEEEIIDINAIKEKEPQADHIDLEIDNIDLPPENSNMGEAVSILAEANSFVFNKESKHNQLIEQLQIAYVSAIESVSANNFYKNVPSKDFKETETPLTDGLLETLSNTKDFVNEMFNPMNVIGNLKNLVKDRYRENLLNDDLKEVLKNISEGKFSESTLSKLDYQGLLVSQETIEPLLDSSQLSFYRNYIKKIQRRSPTDEFESIEKEFEIMKYIMVDNVNFYEWFVIVFASLEKIVHLKKNFDQSLTLKKKILKTKITVKDDKGQDLQIKLGHLILYMTFIYNHTSFMGLDSLASQLKTQIPILFKLPKILYYFFGIFEPLTLNKYSENVIDVFCNLECPSQILEEFYLTLQNFERGFLNSIYNLYQKSVRTYGNVAIKILETEKTLVESNNIKISISQGRIKLIINSKLK